MSDTRPMTPEQAATLKQLAKAAYELDAFTSISACSTRGDVHSPASSATSSNSTAASRVPKQQRRDHSR
jgi:hypothetical protein